MMDAPEPRDPGRRSTGGRAGNIAMACCVVIMAVLLTVLAANVDLSHW